MHARLCSTRLVVCARRLSELPAALFCALLCAVVPAAHAQLLQVTYGTKGVQTIAYGNTMLANVGAFPGDAFHIWHMKSTDLNGNVIPGWGENNYGTNWNASTLTETYFYPWGTIATQFVQQGDNLNMVVTETNNPGSGIVFDGAEIYPFTMHFPRDPAQFNGYSQYAITTTGVGVSAADYGSGVATVVIADQTQPMYVGWKNLAPNTYSPTLTSTAPDGLANFYPRNDRPVAPGTSFTYTVAIRFTPEGTAADTTDATTSYNNQYPSLMTWTDKRIIGTAFLASAPPATGDSTRPAGFPTNPRRFYNDPTIDVTSASGLSAFQHRILTQAATNVTNGIALNGQGIITWDIEGEEYPPATSYVCSPEQIASVAPEMESIITDRNSPYYGQKLDDAYFKTMTSAGLKVGVCIRPQVFAIDGNRLATQSYLASSAAIIANLETKIRFASTRWGVTIFYVDSSVDIYGGTLDAAIYKQLLIDFPNFLFIPEEATPRHYAYSAPFYSFIFHNTTGTPASVYSVYPNAFGANLINDVNPATLAAYTPQLTASVAAGDILMGHADYWDQNNPTMLAIYKAAGPPAGPIVQITPSINWPAPAPITYGAAVSATQLNASSSTPGMFIYTPALGTTLPAGTNTLKVNFTPADTRMYRSATTSVTLQVAQAAPVLNWPAPEAITAGTPLSSAQLNATANIPGSFTYTPAAGTKLPAGPNTLVATFIPTDSTDYALAATSTILIVNPATQNTPSINWPAPASITYGTALSGAQLNASASVPGTFTYAPAAGATLSAGAQTLTVTFTPNDTGSYRSASATVNLQVTQATPALTWPAPASIVAGTPLSAAQLNASASVPGTFTYTPAAGATLPTGPQTLTASFTPSDSINYRAVSTSTSLTVTAAPQTTPVIFWTAPAAIAYGTALNGAQLNATASVPGTFTYSPIAGTILPAGTHTLTVTFTPANSNAYSTVWSSTTLTINQAGVVINWASPASITAGTALSNAQLNATANVPGTFSYSPGAGTVLAAGTQTLTATFTPTDTADYASAVRSVALTVTAAAPAPNPSNPRLFIIAPSAGASVSGWIAVTAFCNIQLDSAGTYLAVDGNRATNNLSEGPFIYWINTARYSNGSHTLQIWAHDTGNNYNSSGTVTINVQN